MTACGIFCWKKFTTKNDSHTVYNWNSVIFFNEANIMKGVDFKIGIIQRQSAAKISHYGVTIKKPKQVDVI